MDKQETQNNEVKGRKSVVEFIRHPFLGKHKILTQTEQTAIDLEKRYETLLDLDGSYKVRKGDPERKKQIKKEVKVLHEQLNELWQQVRKESLEAWYSTTQRSAT